VFDDFLFGSGFGRPNKEAQASFEAEMRALREERLTRAVPWTPDIKWEPGLSIQASTYHPLRLFPVEPSQIVDPNKLPPEQKVVSPDGQWLYCEKILPRGDALRTILGNRKGNVVFDGPVIIPALHQLQTQESYERVQLEGPNLGMGDFRFVPTTVSFWKQNPWMSITPMELLSLRPGTRMARGDVIIAGLGLGHQLIEVSKRPQVRRLMLVERSQGLVDFMMPAIEPHLHKRVEVFVGNAYEVIPQLAADVALIDIFPKYGGNQHSCDKLERTSPGVKKFWCWGCGVIKKFRCRGAA
jgi:hypothetical protein